MLDSASDILRFLARYWAERPELLALIGPKFECTPSVHVVRFPDYHNSGTHPDLTGANRWRWWRYSVFHEAMHDRFSPMDLDAASKLVCESGGFERGFLNLAGYVVNILDDYRVEKLGLRIFKGYVDEREWRNQSARNWLLKNLDPTDYLSKMMDPSARFSELLRRGMLMDISTGDTWLEDFIIRSRGAESYGDLLAYVKEFLAQVRTRYGAPYSHVIYPRIGGNIEPSDDETPTSEPLPFFLDPELEVLRAEEERLNEELGARGNLARVILGESKRKRLVIHDIPVKADWSELMSDTGLILGRMKTLLRKWQTGWVEKLDYMGDDIEPEEFLMSQVSGRERFFLDEVRTSPRRRLAVLLDMSGSIAGARLERAYVKSFGVIAEALDFIGSKFALYAFNSTLFIVKPIELAFSRRVKDSLASLLASSSTDMAFAVDSIRAAHSSERYDALVVVTDGLPNNLKTAIRALQEIRIAGVNPYVLGFVSDASDVSRRIRRHLFDLSSDYGRVRILSHLDALPAAFFELLRT